MSPRARLAAQVAGLLVGAALGGAGLYAAVHAQGLGLGPALVLGAVVLGAVAAGVAHVWSSALHDLADIADALSHGQPIRRASERRSPGLDRLAGSLNRLAARMERTGADLSSERERLSAVLHAMAEGVLAVGETGRVELCNRSAAELLGLRQAPIGRRLVDLLRQPGLQEQLEQARAGRALATLDLTLPDGRQLLVGLQPVGRAGLDVLLVLRDVTALRRLEATRRDFLANASHELRTPVATVRAAAEALLDGALQDPAAGPDFAATILRHAERLSRLLGDMLDLSRLEAGAYELPVGPVPLRERLEHAAQLVALPVAERHQSVRIEVEGQPMARASARGLDQVLFNLVDNASKYAGQGAHIVLGARQTGERVELTVADDGPGVPLHQRQRVFERFYRVDAGRSRQLGGTGLGLAIVRHLVEAMGGRVELLGNPPKGALFRVELPAAVPTGQAQTER